MGVGTAATGNVGVNAMTIGLTSDVPERAMSWLAENELVVSALVENIGKDPVEGNLGLFLMASFASGDSSFGFGRK